MSYRDDRIIRELMDKICGLYREGYGICEYYDESKEPACRLFRDEPAIIRQLELSEERYCPISPKPKKI
ncbi:MAG: hypothetical protein ACUVTD_06745 [Nitrososphaerales archaeon]